MTGVATTPVLHWPGKRPPAPGRLQHAHLVEWFHPTQRNPADASANANALFWGDNLDVLTHLLAHGARGKVKLIYIDPPFDTGMEHRRKVRLRMPKARTMQTSADAIIGAQTQYDDRWPDGGYLQFIYDRLPLLRELLAEDGSLWLHCDHRQAHHLRVLLQEVFGAGNYLNTVVWRSQVPRGAKVNAFYFPFSAHYLEIFARDRRAPTTWNAPRKQIVLNEAEAARAYLRDERGFFRTSDPGTYSFARLQRLHAEGRLYAPYGGEIVIDETARRVYASNGGNIGVKYYLKPARGAKWAVERGVDNLWDDIPGLGVTPGEDLGYPTQKTEALLERVIRTATNPGDLVLDCFMGSGTTLAVAQRLGRRWIGCDNNLGALQTARRRLQAEAARDSSAAGMAIYRLGDDLRPPGELLEATVQIERSPDDATCVTVAIIEVTSPALRELLARFEGTGVQTPLDWRVLVDCVTIDPDYDGAVLRGALVDAPRKKSAQVAGVYTFSAPAHPVTVAVRITDLLGAEALITARV